MPLELGVFSAYAGALAFALAAALAGLGVAAGYRAWKRSRVSPAELERRRRAALVSAGKMGDATVLEMRDDCVLYSYAVRGVAYTASQDLSALKHLLPQDLEAAIGPVLVRYDGRNPANSIILAENWCGLRSSHALPRHRRNRELAPSE
ncbi:MAG TPA: hypothetical protein VKV17_19535 [Bryobacteraceae bacterium]|nr:hypothetical protein [Bryobacteraceae bacterium]